MIPNYFMLIMLVYISSIDELNIECIKAEDE